jgi:valyl-tRNA synthetase
MVLAGLYNLGDVPFTDVFIHANILDGKGERMSKSKGNGIDPVDIIEAYGTDAMRYVLCDMQTGTQDIRLPVTAVCPRCGHHNDLATAQHGSSIFTYLCGKDARGGLREGACGGEFDVLGTMSDLPAATLISERFETGRAFCTKLWNSARFAFMNLHDVPEEPRTVDDLALEDRWILDGLNQAVAEVDGGLGAYNPSQALGAAREFFWGSLCDWYLELIKARLQDPGDDTAPVARQVLAYCLDQVLRLLHPFVPFITEHLWHLLGEQVTVRDLGGLASASASNLLIAAEWPRAQANLDDPQLRGVFAEYQAVTRAVREVRASHGVPASRAVAVTVERLPRDTGITEELGRTMLTRLAKVDAVSFKPVVQRERGAALTIVEDRHVLVHDVSDPEAERARLRKSLAKVEQGITAAEKKLANPKFVSRAPEDVVNAERERLTALQNQRGTLLQSLKELE